MFSYLRLDLQMAELQMFEQTGVFIVRSNPEPDDDVSLKYSKCPISSADTNRIDWFSFTHTLEIQAMSLRIELP